MTLYLSTKYVYLCNGYQDPIMFIYGDSHSIRNQKAGRPTGEGGCKLSDKPGQTGEGESENLDFGRASFMNVP